MATPDKDRVVLAHGGGGQLTDQLLGDHVLPKIGNDVLVELLDSGIVTAGDQRIALTVDSYVVQPLEFPGGDIGRLAISGTVNDLAVAGAKPLGIALSLILAEGLPRTTLERVMTSVGETAREADVQVVTGDTKVVGREQADGIYITTAGVGAIPADRRVHPDRINPEDVLLINGPIADHGLAVMLAREMPEVTSVLSSDAAPLNGLIEALFEAVGDKVAFLRDATRSGLAGVAADLATRTGFHVSLDEQSIPLRQETLHAAEMLGLDPLEVANEGKVVAVVRPEAADDALAAMRAHPLGELAASIGKVVDERDALCEIITPIGGRRILQKPYGEQLPRIC